MFFTRSWRYTALAGSDHDFDSTEKHPGVIDSFLRYSRLRNRKQLKTLIFWTISVVLFITVFAAVSCWLLTSHAANHTTEQHRCSSPAIREEWRAMSHSHQAEYISAVKCLMDLPSVFNAKTTLYDDFVYGHSKTGSYSHYAASFLPWHRMYIYVYERALRHNCAYQGPLPYWDWTLDAHDLSNSPIWDPVTGFGGDGHERGAETLHGGRCVIDGPFANTTRAWRALSEGHSHDVEYGPHCLSRGFAQESATLEVLHDLISTARVAKTLDQPDYAAFFEDFESGAHNAIPQFIHGDFLTFTAPNDPVFFLHHANVDRLWWMWQMRAPAERLYRVRGPSKDFRFLDREDEPEASVEDVMPLGGLAEDTKIKQVLDTRSGFLCYEYN